MIVEILIGFGLGFIFFYFQDKTSKNVEELTKEMHDFIKQKAELEQKYKASKCKIIIELLKDIHDREKSVKETLTNYQMGYLTAKDSKFFLDITVRPFKSRITAMAVTIGKLEEKLNDTTLGSEFLDYLGNFDMLPKRFFVDNLTDTMFQQEQKHLIEGLIHDIDKQMGEIQGFIDRFNKEKTKIT